MRLFCRLGWHNPGPQILWNAGFWFTKCRDCERDLVRSRHRGWHVPVGAKVVWQAKAPAPQPPAEPVKLVEPLAGATAIEAIGDPVPPVIAPAPDGSAPLIAERQAAEIPSAEAQPLAPAERLDLAQFVAEVLHSAGPAVPIQHAVLEDERPLADVSQATDTAERAATEPESTPEGLVADDAGPDAALEDSGEPENRAQTLVADAPAPLELEEPLELAGELPADDRDSDRRAMPDGDAPKGDLRAEEGVVEAVDEAALAHDAPPHADATVFERSVDPGVADAEAEALPADAEPVPAAADETDPWAGFLDDDDEDDEDFAWVHENRPDGPAVSDAAPKPPVTPRTAPERSGDGAERGGAQQLNRPFRSDLDGRKRWNRNSVKR
jgi:hypothetical protein